MRADELQRENAKITQEIHTLIERNALLQRDLVRLNLDREGVVAQGHNHIESLTTEVRLRVHAIASFYGVVMS